jgi:hypothetical protein
MRVLKFEIHEGVNTHAIPVGAQVLSVVEKGHGANLYVAVKDGWEDKPTEEVVFQAVATDTDFPADSTNSTFIGSVRNPGTWTWHVFRLAS